MKLTIEIDLELRLARVLVDGVGIGMLQSISLAAGDDIDLELVGFDYGKKEDYTPENSGDRLEHLQKVVEERAAYLDKIKSMLPSWVRFRRVTLGKP